MTRFLGIILICLYIMTKTAFTQESRITTLYISDEETFMPRNEQEGTFGLFADLFLSAAQNLGRTIEIKKLPWKRAQELARHIPGSAIGPLTRTPKRETQFQWITPLLPLRVSYLSRKDRNLTIETLEQARQMKVVTKLGTASAIAQEQHKIPPENMVVVPSLRQITALLDVNRVDAWLVWDLVGYRMSHRQNNSNKLVAGYGEDRGMLYFAANPDIAPAEIALWQHALNDLISAGHLDEAILRYTGYPDGPLEN